MVKQIHMICFDFFNFHVKDICKENEGEERLGCDACGQYFHASCLNVDYGETLQDMFYAHNEFN